MEINDGRGLVPSSSSWRLWCSLVGDLHMFISEHAMNHHLRLFRSAATMSRFPLARSCMSSCPRRQVAFKMIRFGARPCRRAARNRGNRAQEGPVGLEKVETD